MLPDLMPHLEVCRALLNQVQHESKRTQKSRRSIIVDAISGKKQGVFSQTMTRIPD